MIQTKNLLPLATRILFGFTVLFCLSGAARGATFIVTSDADSGAGTLRQAILDANGTPAVDTINFNIGGGGVRTINLLSPLPAIISQTIINGYTQPGSSPNTLAVGSNAVLNIELNGAGAGAAIGLRCSNACDIYGLVINRFQEGGIRVDNGNFGALISGNYIGTNAAGTAALGNINYGILILNAMGLGISIGDFTPEGRNVISGNSGTGITISAGGSGIDINDNYIGTGKNGTADLGNTSHGILIANSSSNIMNGNVISGNTGSGVAILTDFGFTASGNLLQQNFIGVDANGNTALGNNGSGVLVQSSGNFIGSTSTALRNVISGNGANGVSIGTNFATGNVVRGNYIGVGNNGTTSIPNTDNGIQIANLAAGNTIGGTTGLTPGACTGVCNIIANNGSVSSLSARAGIYLDITAGAGNAIRANSIFNNTGTGIDLGATGATANDAGDLDTGPNNLQNKPVITVANTNEAISGTLNSTASTTFDIDFFINTTPPDTSVTSEGRTYIGSTTATTNAGGNASFSFTSTVQLNFGQFVTATATATGTAPPFAPQAVGDSSEHSDAFAVTFVTTAANVSLSGRVTSAKRGVSRAYVYLTSLDGRTVVARTNSFGYYRFDAVSAGETYTISVRHKTYQFEPQIFTVNEDLENVNFVPNQ